MLKKTANILIINSGLLLSGLVMIFSGLLIQAEYHMEGHGEIDTEKIVIGFIYSAWSAIHKTSAIIVLSLMAFHILQHWSWFKSILKKRLFRKNRQVLILTIVFIIVTITGLIPWGIKLSSGNEAIRKAYIEIHDKIALVLFVYLILHISKRINYYGFKRKDKIINKRNI